MSVSSIPVVSVTGFRKCYGSFTAVDGVDFQLHRGEILALLGPNGAGKTSTLECLEGLRRPDGGTIKVLGLDPERDAGKLASRVGVQLQSQGLPQSMTVRETLEFFSRYRGREPSETAALGLGLGEKMDASVSELSTGQQRRLALALAVQHDPELVILDEPTAGLDVETRDSLHALMAGLREKGTSILLATHDMAEAEKLADRVVVIVRGKIAAAGTPREITAGGAGITRISVSTRDSILAREKTVFRIEAADSGGSGGDRDRGGPGGSAGSGGIEGVTLATPAIEGVYAVYLCRNPAKLLGLILSRIAEAGDEIVDLRVERPSLEERFLEIVGSKS